MWISFEFELYAVEENRGQVIVCLEREGEISETLTVTVSTNEMDQAKCKVFHFSIQGLYEPLSRFITADDDFVQISGVPVQFRPDQYRACFPISIINDEVYEGVSENFTVAISTVPLGVGLGETDSTIISIVDDDSEIYSFIATLKSMSSISLYSCSNQCVFVFLSQNSSPFLLNFVEMVSGSKFIGIPCVLILIFSYSV